MLQNPSLACLESDQSQCRPAVVAIVGESEWEKSFETCVSYTLFYPKKNSCIQGKKKCVYAPMGRNDGEQVVM